MPPACSTRRWKRNSASLKHLVAAPLEQHSLFEQRDRFLQRQVARLELLDHGLELGQGLVEWQRRDLLALGVGFFGKLFVFNAAIDAHLYVLAVIGVVASVISCFYYIRIVKVMCFDQGDGVFDRPDLTLRVVLLVCAVFVVLGVFVPNPVAQAATSAAASLFPG